MFSDCVTRSMPSHGAAGGTSHPSGRFADLGRPRSLWSGKFTEKGQTFHSERLPDRWSAWIVHAPECHWPRSRNHEPPWPGGPHGRSWRSRRDVTRQVYGLGGGLPLCTVSWVARSLRKESATSEGIQRGCGWSSVAGRVRGKEVYCRLMTQPGNRGG